MRYARFAGLSVALAAVVLAGCAAGPSVVQDSAGAVVGYEPPTKAERLAQETLLATDDAIRPVLERQMADAEDASREYGNAVGMLTAEDLPADAKRPTDKEVEALRVKAHDALKAVQDSIQSQIDAYQRFLETYPENWYARHRYAWFLADQNRRFPASEEWRKVIAMEPRFPFAYNNLASLYNHMGRDIEAIELYRKAIELKPDDATFHVNLAVNYSTHRHDVAEKYGWSLPRIFEECIAEYKMARALAPDDVNIARDLASQYILAKHFGVENTADRALEDWQYMLNMNLTAIERGQACRNVGRIYLIYKKDYAKAVEWLEKAQTHLENDPSCEVLLKRAREGLEQPPRSTPAKGGEED